METNKENECPAEITVYNYYGCKIKLKNGIEGYLEYIRKDTQLGIVKKHGDNLSEVVYSGYIILSDIKEVLEVNKYTDSRIKLGKQFLSPFDTGEIF